MAGIVAQTTPLKGARGGLATLAGPETCSGGWAHSRHQFSADYTIGMFEFDFRQGQA